MRSTSNPLDRPLLRQLSRPPAGRIDGNNLVIRSMQNLPAFSIAAPTWLR